MNDDQNPLAVDPHDHWLEDFSVGMRFLTAAKVITEAEIIGFAEQFDPQYYHVDPKAAAASDFGGLIASGFHMLSASFRLFFDLNLWPNAIIASPGMDSVKFLRPLRPGDEIRVTVEVTDIRPSKSRPDRGLVVMLHETRNQKDEVILSVDCMHMLKYRPGH